jgi:hypothetical protein
VLLILAARGEELSDNTVLWKVLRSLRRGGTLTEHAIEALEPEAVAQLVSKSGASMAADRVYQQSGGNPLFALELLRGQTDGAESLPESVADAVRDRVERLTPASYDVLRWAAVLGAVFAPERLNEVMAVDASEVVSALELLHRSALVGPSGGAQSPTYRFSHEVVRRVVYADISEPRRRLMHRRVAQALEALEDPDGSRVAEVAHHAALGHDDDLAALACRRAGQRCVKMFANQQALSLARRGLRHAEKLPNPARVKRTIELLEVVIGSGPADQSNALAAQLERLSEEALDLECTEHARLAFFLLGFVTWDGGEWESTRRRMHQIAAASRVDSSSNRVDALAAAGRCLVMLERDLPQAHAMLLEAEARAKVLDVESVALLDGLGMIEVHRGRVDRGAPLLLRARQLASAERDRMHEFNALEHIAVMQLEDDDYGSASATAGDLRQIGDRMREGSEGPFARAVVGLIGYALGQPDVAELEPGLQGLRLADAKHRLAYVLTHAALIDLRRNDSASARERALEALPIAKLLERGSETLLALVILARSAQDTDDRVTLEQVRSEIAGGDWSSVSASVRRRHAELLGSGLEPRVPHADAEASLVGAEWTSTVLGPQEARRA